MIRIDFPPETNVDALAKALHSQGMVMQLNSEAGGHYVVKLKEKRDAQLSELPVVQSPDGA